MKASETGLLGFLRKAEQFVIPIYQRTYSWTERECRQIWDDILRAGRNENIPAHFIGSIVYIEAGPHHHVSTRSQMLVIDGQQRLTTVILIIEALAREVGDTEPIDGFSAKKLRNRYLSDPDEDGEAAHKLLLTQTDKQTLLAIVDNKPLPDGGSLRLKENFEFFENEIKSLGGSLASLCMGLAKLMVVDIALSREHDNPQLIFESMNSTGRELSQADLIRNFILMGLEPQHQSRLYNDYWRPIEVAFGQKAYAEYFDDFMRYYLTVKEGELPNIRKVYEKFKEYAHRNGVNANGMDALVADLHKFAGHYCAIGLGQEENHALKAAFADLRELKVNVTYPFLLELYNDYTEGILSAEELEQAVRLVESYVFRRAVCQIPTNSLNKTFAAFGKTVKKDRYLESIKAQFELLPSYRRFPGDDEFRREIVRRDLYNFPRRNYWLRRLENHDRKEPAPVHEYTIEHIMPQNENLSKEWQAALGEGWRQVHKEFLHTLGNLTLTAYNPELSDRSFPEKRKITGGFGDSPLRLNEDLRRLETWNESEIRARADRLAKKAVTVWTAPSLSEETLDVYRPKAQYKVDSYTIEDHKHLADGGNMCPLFEDFRKAVLGLDPCVAEEFRKFYVSYKAETNFTDVIGQANNLKLYLNMQFDEIDDPKGFARDVTGIGHYGIGDIEISLRKPEELPYVMNLVRQAFENQMEVGAR